MEQNNQNLQQNGATGVIGQPMNRVDGRLKVTGAARFAAEFPIENLAHAAFANSRVARGSITAIDTREAERAPGVVAVLTHLNMPRLAKQPEFKAGGIAQSFAALQGAQIHYANQPTAMVIADTVEQAEYAASLVRVTFREEKPIATMRDKRAKFYEPKAVMGGFVPGRTVRGEPQKALAGAAVRVDATFRFPIHHHNPIEPWSTIAAWDGDNLTLYDSTAGVTRTQTDIAQMLGVAPANLRVVAPFVGGTFGGKNNSWSHVALVALAAKRVRRPVSLVVTREQMFTTHGHREEQELKLSLGADASGKLTAISHEKRSMTSDFDEFAEPSGNVINMFYQCPNFECVYRLARANTMTPTFMRAPGESPGMFALESLMDELAYKIGVDPIELRLRNYAEVDPTNNHPFSSKSLCECYRRGAEIFGWSRRNPQPGSMRAGGNNRYLVGYGVASATYPVYRSPASARARIFADGRAIVQSGAADIGTGTYTVMTQVAAAALGIAPDSIKFELGDTNLPTAPNAGGSATAGAVSSAVHVACNELRRKIIALAVGDEKSPLRGARPESIEVEQGRLFVRGDRARGETYAALLTRLALTDIEELGEWKPDDVDATAAENPDGRPNNPKNSEGTANQAAKVEYSMHSFGAKFAEVAVDRDLGIVRVTRLVGVYGAGRILNEKTARSQMRGGMIWGIGQALTEETAIDERNARFVNASLADYHVPTNADVPEIQIEFVPERDEHINVLGVKGVGELGIVGVAPAIANAVFHATGKRIRSLPITPDKLF